MASFNNNSSFSRVAASRSQVLEPSDFSTASLKIVKTDIAPTGEAVQLVRPMVAQQEKTTEQIVGDLVNKYDYKKNNLVKANENDLASIEQAFGSNLASQLLTTYDGSAIVTDTQQDLIGEKYLSEQIKRVQEYQKKNSVIDRYSHLLYEGEKDYQSNARDDLKFYAKSNSLSNLKPVQQTEYVLQQAKLQPTASSKLLASSSNLVKSQNASQSQLQQQQQPSASQTQVYQLSSSRQASGAQLSLQEQLRRIQEEKLSLERQQQEMLQRQRLEQERLVQERIQQERLLQERIERERVLAQERARQEQEKIFQERLVQEKLANERALQERARQEKLQQDEWKRQMDALAASEQQQRKDAELAAASAATAAAAAQQQQQQQQQRQQSQTNLQNSQSTTSTSNQLRSVTIDAYNDPQFKALLDQLTRPLQVPVENIEIPAQWPSSDSIAHLADPIVIPAPDPIVISAPDIIRLNDTYANSNSQSHFKTEVTFYPKVVDQKFYTNFDLNQLNLNKH